MYMKKHPNANLRIMSALRKRIYAFYNTRNSFRACTLLWSTVRLETISMTWPPEMMISNYMRVNSIRKKDWIRTNWTIFMKSSKKALRECSVMETRIEIEIKINNSRVLSLTGD